MPTYAFTTARELTAEQRAMLVASVTTIHQVEAMARQEVERYTFRSPGQATSYYYGYTRWMQLRSQVEMALGPKFDRLRYHDYILSQGLLPPDVLSKAVLTEFVAAEKAR